MSVFRLFLSGLLATTCLLTGCEQDEPAPTLPGSPGQGGNNTHSAACPAVAEEARLPAPASSVNIENVWVDGTEFKLAVAYGGCSQETDGFSLVWDGQVAESYPTQVTLAIQDNRPQDVARCMALFNDTLCYDASQVLQQAGDRSRITIQAQNEALLTID